MGVKRVGLVLSFSSGNSSMVDDHIGESVSVLKKVIEKLEDGQAEAPILDLNGNYIGNWSLDVEEDDESTD